MPPAPPNPPRAVLCGANFATVSESMVKRLGKGGVQRTDYSLRVSIGHNHCPYILHRKARSP
jgi:hypothetical protein